MEEELGQRRLRHLRGHLLSEVEVAGADRQVVERHDPGERLPVHQGQAPDPVLHHQRRRLLEVHPELAAAGTRLELEAVGFSPLAEVDPAAEPEPSHVVTVYGVDHPGIVHAVTSALAQRGVDITDLTTRVLSEGIYALMMEVSVPPGTEIELEAVAQEQGVDVTVRPLESDVL